MDQSFYLLTFFVAVGVWSLAGAQSSSIVPISFNTPSTCSSSNQFFHTGNLSCVSCPPNSLTSADGLSCECQAGYRSDSTVATTCVQCTNNSVVSTGGYYCLQCQSPLVFSNGACSGCDITSIFTDILPANSTLYGQRQCTQCPVNMWSNSEKNSCIHCGISNCSSCTVINGGVCFSTNLPAPITQPFPFYINYYSSSLALCNNGNLTACQLLVNLCVLQNYNRQDVACQQVLALSATRSDIVPQLYYPQNGAGQYLSNTIVNAPLSVSDGSNLTVMAASFALNGTFFGLQVVSDSLMLCKDRPSKSAAAWQPGVQYEIQCSIDYQELNVEASNPVFYDLFLLDGNQLVPIPILVDGYSDENNGLVNQGEDSGQWQFVRRFFLAQSITNNPSYVQSTVVNVQLKTGGHIEPPYFHVTYQSIPSTSSVKAHFSVIYSSGDNNFNIGLAVVVAAFVVIATIYTGIKINGFMRRSGLSCCELQTYIHLLIQFLSILSTLFLLGTSIAAIFWLIFFKSQQTLLLALPTSTQLIAFITLLVLALVFRAIQITYLIWKQSSVQIFLIDWEKPRVGHAQDQPTATPTPVSIWRTYFVANEWNEIQTLRKLNPSLVLALTLLFLEVIGLKNLAEQDPQSNVTTPPDRYSAPHSLILRIGLAVSFYFFFAVILRLYMIIVHERYIEHKIHQFVDLCSVSNVSIFILFESFFGYYIHGRSVHGRADTDMREMNENLIKEKEDMCSRRGLLPDSDEQTFEVAINRIFHTHFYKVLSALNSDMEVENLTGNERRTISEASLKTYEELTLFLTSFIEHNMPNCEFILKRKILLERGLGIEFNDAVDRSFFYTDTGNSFTDVLFYGHEWQLLSFEMLIFLVTDLAAGNYILSAIITYIISKILSFIRQVLGRRNLGKKTLIDARFLI